MTITPFAHQSQGVDALAKHARYYLAWSMGTGKTFTVLWGVQRLGGRTVVVAPKSVVRTAWANDTAHFPEIRTVIMPTVAKAKRLALIAGPWDILVLNYETLRAHWQDIANQSPARLVLDESSRCKNYKSQTTLACTNIADRCESVWLLSGTPAPNCPSEWIPQMRILSRAVFGPSYWSALNRYFVPVKRRLRDGRQIVERLTQTPEQKIAYVNRLSEFSWSLRKEDCLTLPSKTDQLRDVELSKDESAAYRAAEEDLVLMLKSGEVSAIRREAALIKLRQIVGGNVISEGVPSTLGSSKLDALAELLDEIGPSEPVVIWAEFREEIRRIEAMIRERGETVGRIDGETSDKAGITAAAFQSGAIKRIVCHPASAGHGITLHAASYTVYYSLSFSSEQHEQSRDRIHRVGQTRNCTYVYLLAEDTVDRAMLGVVRRKRTVSDTMAEMLKKPVRSPASV